VELSLKEEAILDLFNEQAFGPAFGRVLLSSIHTLIEKGLPPEAVLIEMYMSNEMGYTYKKMSEMGLLKQVSKHSSTSQYGAMSRGLRYLKLPLKDKFQQTFDEISSGAFAKEWDSQLAKLKFKVIKYFALRQRINRIEKQVRRNLHLKDLDVDTDFEDVEELLNNKKIRAELAELFEHEEFSI
jgi:ketol-acid reductoisomerase